MPIYRGKDKIGYFYQWGKNRMGYKKWTKYYYNPNDINSKKKAKIRAIKQGLAAKIFQGRKL